LLVDSNLFTLNQEIENSKREKSKNFKLDNNKAIRTATKKEYFSVLRINNKIRKVNNIIRKKSIKVGSLNWFIRKRKLDIKNKS